MIRKILLLFCMAAVAASAVAQNTYEEVINFDVRNGRMVLRMTVKGAPCEFLLDPTRSASALLSESVGEVGAQAIGEKVVLEKVGVGQNLFVQKITMAVISDNTLQQLGVAGVLGRDIFKESILTIDKRERSLTLSSPYKPSYMTLRNRTDLTAQGNPTVSVAGRMTTAPLDSLLATGVVAFDFVRAKIYFEPHATLVKPKSPAVAVNKAPVTEGAITHLDREMFLRDVFDFRQKSEWEYQGDLPCVIDFWATWCKPCLKLSPLIGELAKQYEGRVTFYKVNVDKEKEIAAGYFNVNAIPLLIFIPKKGEPQRMLATSKEEIEKKIEEFLLK